MKRLVSVALFALLFLLCAAVSLADSEQPAPPEAAQDAPPEDPLEEQANALLSEIEQLKEAFRKSKSQYRKSEGEDRTIAWMQMLANGNDIEKRLDQLVQLVVKMRENSLDVSAVSPLVGQVVLDESILLFGNVEEVRSRLTRMLKKRAELEPDQRAAVTHLIKEGVQNHNLLLGAIYSNIQRQQTLGLQAEQDLQRFDALLRQWADDLYAHIELIRKEQSALQEAFNAAAEERKADLAAQLKAVKARLDTGTSSLGLIISLMKERDIESGRYSKLLITSTGQISHEIFEKGVAVELASEWFKGVKLWVAENGLALLFKALVVIAILFGFYLLAGIVGKFVARAVGNSRLSVSHLLRDFAISSSRKLVMVLGILVALSQMSVDVGPMLAGLGVAGFIIGFALKDTLSNFASGIMILVYRPFDVGDSVELDGVIGKVRSMTLVSTTILTFDNQQLMIPNNNIWGNTIKNITARHTRRVDLTFGVSYEDDIEHVESVLQEIVTSHPLVLAEPQPMVRLSALNDSSVDFIVRPWSKTTDYWDVYWDITRQVKLRFDQEGISIPYPQRDLHLRNLESRAELPASGAPQPK